MDSGVVVWHGVDLFCGNEEAITRSTDGGAGDEGDKGFGGRFGEGLYIGGFDGVAFGHAVGISYAFVVDIDEVAEL